MRVLILTLILHIPFFAAAGPSEKKSTVSTDIVLPSESCHGLFIVSMSVGAGDGATVDLLLDTGAYRTYIDPAAVRRILGPEVSAGRVLFKTAQVGEYEFGPLRAYVLPLAAISLALRRRIDGVLGYSAFKEVLLTLDYPADEVRVSSGRLPRPDGREVFRDSGFIRPHLKIDVGRRRINVLLDSGSTGRFLLKPKDRLRWSVEPRPARTAMEVTGIKLDAGGRLAQSIGVGPLRFDAPVVFVSKRERLVGWHVLHNFTLTFDQRTHRIRMVPVSDAPVRMPSYVGNGLGVRSLPEGLEVVAVFPGTSAAAAGLRKNDLIVAIDGVPVHERGCADPKGKPAGENQVLSFVRDGTRIQTEITTEILIP